MTTLRKVILRRAYFACQACGLGGYCADRLLGPQGFLTRQASRLIGRLGGRNSFAVAEQLGIECCGWTVSDERIRQACQAEATRIVAFRTRTPVVAKAFAAAAGDVEFETDAAKVNTTAGWRDRKIGLFARRERGASTTPADWDKRDLPAPSTRTAFAAVEAIDDCAPRWSQWAARLGIKDLTTITVLGDGAESIGNAASRQFGGCHQVLAIDHAAEPIADAAKRRFGDATAAEWLDQGRMLLLSDGGAGLRDHLGQTLATDNNSDGRAALDELTSDFATPTERLNDGHRLDTGESIGSGMVEGAAKTLIGRRLKQTGARWEVANVNNMAELCCLTSSDHGALDWASPN